MKVFIAGIDGYLGWALAQHLTARGHEVAGNDLFLRRQWVEEVGSQSAIPISSIDERLQAFRERFGTDLNLPRRQPARLSLSCAAFWPISSRMRLSISPKCRPRRIR